jgi:hypothetical protein
MSTTIKSSALDFVNIKNNLKNYLIEKGEFADYNFEASGLSNILDVLAYNTHLNALTANFALNESFLSTAQLRSSIISLAEGVGYIPDSKSSAEARIRMALNLSGITDRQNTITVASGYKFTSVIDGTIYKFQTQETIQATDDGAGYYRFTTLDGSADIPIYEGESKTKTFIAGDNDEYALYIIPDVNMDINTAIVKVYENPTSSSYITYTNILDATTINEQSTLYILKEMPNGYYELSFGNGTTLGQTPKSGYKIVVQYLSCNGEAGNNALIFQPADTIKINNTTNRTPKVTTRSRSVGGAEKESIESIRKNAPFQYAAQNRMVTHVDYSSLVLRNFSNLITDIKAWGGEDNAEPEFGTVFMSIKFNDDVPADRIVTTKNSIKDLSDQLGVASFDIKFTDPITTYIEPQVFFQFNPRLTTLSLNTIQDNVRTVIENYFTAAVGKFESSFRRSNMLSLVDDVSPAVLSSRADIKMQQRLIPSLGVERDYTFTFPVPIADPDDVQYRVSSSSFFFRNQTCQIRNQLNSNKLQVINLATNKTVVDNVGTYTPSTGKVNFVGLQIDQIVGGGTYVKISAVPSNQSAISPLREYILEQDVDRTTAKGVLVTATN